MTQRSLLSTLFALFALFAGGLLLLPGAAEAQIPGLGTQSGGAAEAAVENIDPGTLTQPEIRELLSRLSDDEVRALLLQQLDRAAAADSGADRPGLVEQVEQNGKVIRARLATMLGAAPEVPAMIGLIGTRLDTANGLLQALLALAACLAAGLAAGWLWRRRIRGQQDRIAQRNVAAGAFSSAAVFGDAVIWLLLELSGVLVFLVTALIVMFVVWSEPVVLQQFLSAYIWAIAMTLVVLAVVEFCLPRDWPAYRMLPLNDAATWRIKAFVVVLAIVYTAGFSTCKLLVLYGAEPWPHALMLSGVALLFTAIMAAMFASLRADIANLIRGDAGDGAPPSYFRTVLAHSWHVLAIGYVVLLLLLAIGHNLLNGAEPRGIGPGVLGLLLFFAVPAIDFMAGRYIAAQCGSNQALSGALRRTLRVVLIVGAAALFMHLWGFDLDRLNEIGIAGWLVGAAIDVGVVLLIGYAAWQLTRSYFDNLLAADGAAALEARDPNAPPKADGEGGGGGATRAATLLPLLRTVALATIGTMAVLTALSGLGVDIGPLLAGAGVVGIAIGFGAQTLVRDIVSGVFFLVDDAFRMGEYIVVGNTRGAVEKISIRSLRLRHHRGPLHTVPFGEIKTLTNYSRDWVIMKLPLRLTYATDPQKVKKIIKVIAAEMAADPLLAPGLLEPPKSQGVLQMEDSAMILRVKFMARPGEQFVLRRELLHRIRVAFAAEGIHFANREVTVHVAGSKVGAEETETAVAAAARSLIDQEDAAKAARTPADDR